MSACLALMLTTVTPTVGDVVLHCPRAGLAIEVDGKPVGETGYRAARLRLPLGARRLTLLEAGEVVFQTRAWVVPQETAVVAKLPPLAEDYRPWRRPLFWSGVGMAAAGVSFMSYAALAAPDFVVTCDPSRRPCNFDFQFHTFGSLRALDTTGPETPNGPLVVPLGYSLLFAGLTWTGSSLLFSEDELPAWIPVALGAFGGAFLYALSHEAAGPAFLKTPFDVRLVVE